MSAVLNAAVVPDVPPAIIRKTAAIVRTLWASPKASASGAFDTAPSAFMR